MSRLPVRLSPEQIAALQQAMAPTTAPELVMPPNAATQANLAYAQNLQGLVQVPSSPLPACIPHISSIEKPQPQQLPPVTDIVIHRMWAFPVYLLGVIALVLTNLLAKTRLSDAAVLILPTLTAAFALHAAASSHATNMIPAAAIVSYIYAAAIVVREPWVVWLFFLAASAFFATARETKGGLLLGIHSACFLSVAGACAMVVLPVPPHITWSLLSTLFCVQGFVSLLSPGRARTRVAVV